MQAGLSGKSQLLLVTIPDFGATPTGPQYANGFNIYKGLTVFNDIIKAEGLKRGLPVADVFDIFHRDAGNSSLIAAVGLRPVPNNITYGARGDISSWDATFVQPITCKLFYRISGDTGIF